MHDLAGKTAVITGGASGMGRSFAHRFGRAGMNLVLGDIEEPALNATVSELTDAGHHAVGLPTDVGDEAAMRALADAADEHFSGAHVVCLNAGVGGGNGDMDTLTTQDWAWTLNVNLWGVIHGIGAFLPALKAQDDGHIVITASVAGLTSYPSMGPYNTTKHAAVAIAETLFSELRDGGSHVGVSCLCPGLVMTNIFSSDRNRPEALQTPGPLIADPMSPDEQARIESIIEMVSAHAKSPDLVADLVHDAVLADQFWIHTDDDFTAAIEARLDSIRDRTDPPGRQSILDQYR
ncbi:MAG: SDR family NAD(P)-dependent oxidoreductase [Acidimicrobiia bacterium]|nr:SDR family NAD(P)-dependent oxidoreductase [Acidimicrobiia bacterium]